MALSYCLAGMHSGLAVVQFACLLQARGTASRELLRDDHNVAGFPVDLEHGVPVALAAPCGGSTVAYTLLQPEMNSVAVDLSMDLAPAADGANNGHALIELIADFTVEGRLVGVIDTTGWDFTLNGVDALFNVANVRLSSATDARDYGLHRHGGAHCTNPEHPSRPTVTFGTPLAPFRFEIPVSEDDGPHKAPIPLADPADRARQSSLHRSRPRVELAQELAVIEELLCDHVQHRSPFARLRRLRASADRLP